MSLASRERENLGALLLQLGPDAPTLLDGWTTRDLAAHLYVREHRLPWGVGNFFAPLAKRLGKEMDKARNRPYEDNIQDWLAGPSKFAAPLFAPLNTGENFVHHEDVRRAQGTDVQPRALSAAAQERLLKSATSYGKVTLRKAPVPVILTPEHLPPVTLGDKSGVSDQGDRVVRVFGDPSELLLWVVGRAAVAKVRVDNEELLEGYEMSVG